MLLPQMATLTNLLGLSGSQWSMPANHTIPLAVTREERSQCLDIHHFISDLTALISLLDL